MTPERRAEAIVESAHKWRQWALDELMAALAAADELAAIREALRGVPPHVTCPACWPEGSGEIDTLEKSHPCGRCGGTGTIDPVDGPETTLELVQRVKAQMDDMECAGTEQDTRWRMEREAYYKLKAETVARTKERCAELVWNMPCNGRPMREQFCDAILALLPERGEPQAEKGR